MPMFMTSAVRGLLLRTIDVCGKGGWQRRRIAWRVLAGYVKDIKKAPI